MSEPSPAAVAPSELPFSAHFAIDVAPVWPLIKDFAPNAPDSGSWVEKLMQGARIAELDEPAAQLVGSPAGRRGMIGQAVAYFAPRDIWPILARLIIAAATDEPGAPARSSPIDSFMLDGAVLSLWRPRGQSPSARFVSVAVEGVLRDDRSPWAVRASEQRYRRLIHYLPTALLQVDAGELSAVFQQLHKDGVEDLQRCTQRQQAMLVGARELVRVTDANLGAVMLFGASAAEDLLGSIDYLFALSPETQCRIIEARFNGRRSFAEQIRIRRFDGEQRDIQLSVTYPTPPEQLDVTLISLEDITERLRTEAQLRQVQQDYSRATRIALMGELSSSIAHEVNQPLSAIAMNAETSLRWLDREQPNLEKVIQLTTRIADSARHASEIVQRVRAMAASHLPERSHLDLNEVAEEALLFVQHDLDAHSIMLERRLDRTAGEVLGDRVQLQQVVVNLLVNSIQAIVQSGQRHGRIELRTFRRDDGSSSLAITDNGPGVAPEHLDRVFEGFFSTKKDGMGIGLAVCHSIIGAHGGEIMVENEPGGGAQFRFSLPPAQADKSSPPQR